MGKNRHTEGDNANEAQQLDENLHLGESKKEKKKADKLKKKQERLEQQRQPGSPMSPGAQEGGGSGSGAAAVAQWGPPDSVEDAQRYLSTVGITLPQGAPRLPVEYAGGRKIEGSSSVFSKQKARC